MGDAAAQAAMRQAAEDEQMRRALEASRAEDEQLQRALAASREQDSDQTEEAILQSVLAESARLEEEKERRREEEQRRSAEAVDPR